MSEEFLFKARTNEGYLFKVLTELLLQNIKTCCFVLTESDISVRMTDNLKKILIDMKLDSENFQVYKFKYDSKKMIGLNLQHLHKMLKSVKKKDTVEIFIKNNSDNDFGIKVIPKDNTRITTSYIKIQNIQNINVQLDTYYDNPQIILSNDYQKMIKDMITIGNLIEIQSTENTIKFICIADGIYSREVEFGDKEEDESNNIVYQDTFFIEQLHKLIKLSGLGSKLYIYTNQNKPLYFKRNIGGIGVINIYIKSKSLIDEHNQENN